VARTGELRLSRICSIIARSGIARPNLQGSYVYSSPKNAGRLERPAGVLQRAVYATDLGFGFVLAFGCLLCFAVNSAATAFSTFSTSTR